ncbi:MAG: transporter [Bacilli bacterium]|nr:transporter [Bacilli bacterium]
MRKFKDLFSLHILLFFFSLTSVFSKLASNEIFLSFKFILYYGISILILGVYAVMWQQILKKFSLSFAFINKGITVIWGMVFGYFIFSEGITINMIIGSVIVLVGISMVATNE